MAGRAGGLGATTEQQLTWGPVAGLQHPLHRAGAKLSTLRPHRQTTHEAHPATCPLAGGPQGHRVETKGWGWQPMVQLQTWGWPPTPNLVVMGLVVGIWCISWRCHEDQVSMGHGPGHSRLERARMGEACVPSPAPTAATSPLQFCRFQEVTLTDLQGVVSNYNLSHSINTRFLGLASETQAMALAVNQSLATVQDHLGHLKTWMCKTQHRSQKVDSRLLALGTALSERRAQCSRDRKEQAAQRDTLSQLALGVWALQDKMAHLTHLVQSEGVRLAALEGWPQVPSPDPTVPRPPLAQRPALPGPPGPSSLKPQGAGRCPELLLSPGTHLRTLLSISRGCRSPQAQAACGHSPRRTRKE